MTFSRTFSLPVVSWNIFVIMSSFSKPSAEQTMLQPLHTNVTYCNDAYLCFSSKIMETVDKWIEQNFDSFIVGKLCQKIDHQLLQVLGVGSGNG